MNWKIIYKALLIIVFLLPAGSFAAGWNCQPVDDGSYGSIALDSAERPHISYDDDMDHTLKYASWESASCEWKIQTVDPSGTVAFASTSLVLDSSWRPHISYQASGNLKYASWESLSNTWKISIVDATAGVGKGSSLAIDNAGKLHISYLDSANQGIKYASWESGWKIQNVDNSLDFTMGGGTSLALDKINNIPHICYWGYSTSALNYQVRYASWEALSKTWKIQVLATAPLVPPLRASVALDISGKPHISYACGSSGLKYASWAAGWSIQTVDPTNTSDYPYLKFDSAGVPHISYVNAYPGNLMYASLESGTWNTQPVDICWGSYSIALDSKSRPHFCYYTNKVSYAAWDEINPFVTVEAPSLPNITLECLSKYIIRWKVSDNIGYPYANYVSIYFSSNEGQSWTLLTGAEKNDTATTGTCEWTVPDIFSNNCLISIEVTDGGGNIGRDISNNKFSIADLIGPVVTVDAPAAGQTFKGGSVTSIAWRATDNFGIASNSTTIEFSSNNGSTWNILQSGYDTSPFSWTVNPVNTTQARIRVKVRDTAGNTGVGTSAAFTIDSTGPLVTVDAPAATDALKGGDSFSVAWRAIDISGIASSSTTIEFSSNNGATWSILQSGLNPSLPYTYNWTVNPVSTTAARIRVKVRDTLNNTGIGTSAAFTIDSTGPLVTVDAPAAGQTFKGGSVTSIAWRATDNNGIASNSTTIEFSSDNGSTWGILQSGLNASPYSWTVNPVNTTQARIRVKVKDTVGNTGVGISAAFTIDSAGPVVTVDAPAATDVLKGGNSFPIAWRATDINGIASSSTTIEFSLDNGATWIILKSGWNTSSYNWTVPLLNTTEARIRVKVRDTLGNVGIGTSPPFSIEFKLGPPEIITNSIKIDGVNMSSATGYISRRPVIEADIKDIFLDLGLTSVEVQIGRYRYVVVPTIVDSLNKIIHVICTPEADITSGGFAIYAKNYYGEVDEFIRAALKIAGNLRVDGRPKNIPNPFRPRHGEGTTIVYILTDDGDIKFIIYDVTGRLVWQRYFLSKTMGGRVNENRVDWNGKTDFGEYAANGAYIYLITHGDSILAKGQMALMD